MAYFCESSGAGNFHGDTNLPLDTVYQKMREYPIVENSPKYSKEGNKENIQQIVEIYISTDPASQDKKVLDEIYGMCPGFLAEIVCNFLNKKYPKVQLNSKALYKGVIMHDNRERASTISALITDYFSKMKKEYGCTIGFVTARSIDELFAHSMNFQRIDFGNFWAIPYKYAPVNSIVVINLNGKTDEISNSIEVLDKMPDKICKDVGYFRVTSLGIFTINIEDAFDEDPYWVGPYEDGSIKQYDTYNYDYHVLGNHCWKCVGDCIREWLEDVNQKSISSIRGCNDDYCKNYEDESKNIF